MILRTPHDGKKIYVWANLQFGGVSNEMLRNILDITPCEECIVFNHKEEIAHLIDYDIMRDYPDVSFRIEDNMFDSVQDSVSAWSRNCHQMPSTSTIRFISCTTL